MDPERASLPRPTVAASRHLVIELRPGQRLLVNGAELLFRSRSTMVLCNRMRFLFGRQVLDPAEATTPARRLYLALQAAYAGPEEVRSESLDKARRLVAEQMAERGAEGCAQLAEASAAIEAGELRKALASARRLFAEDDGVAEPRAA